MIVRPTDRERMEKLKECDEAIERAAKDIQETKVAAEKYRAASQANLAAHKRLGELRELRRTLE